MEMNLFPIWLARAITNGIRVASGLIVLALFVICCSTNAKRSERIANNHEANILPIQAHTPTSAIRSIDFDNISYPNFPDYSDPNGRAKKFVTLKPGEGGPNFINFGDITGDGVEDAMVALGIDNHGSAIPDYVYIFMMEDGKLKLIWDFETGDRADGGLRNVYSENGQLIIELFGRDRVIGGQLYRGEEGLCCPSSFTRTRYRWTGKHFEQISKEVLSNPSGGANPVMPHYDPKK
jgi:hypothetical protein